MKKHIFYWLFGIYCFFGSSIVFSQNDTGSQNLSQNGGILEISFIPAYTSTSSEMIAGAFTIQVPCGTVVAPSSTVGSWVVGSEFTAALYSSEGCGTLAAGSCFRRITFNGNTGALNAISGVPIVLFTLSGSELCPAALDVPILLVEPICAAIQNGLEIDGDGTSGPNGTNTFANTGIDPGSGVSSCALLPIELLSFNAKNKHSHIALSWVTASEINNSHFEIERSADGNDFEMIATVDGAGNSSQTLEYSYNDMTPLNGTNYYRLVNVDFDETRHFSPIRSVYLNQ